MTQGDVLAILQEALLLTLRLAGPILLVSIGIGLIIAIFQAATQIHEQTLTFVPKVLVLALLLLMLGSTMITMISEFVRRLFEMMASV